VLKSLAEALALVVLVMYLFLGNLGQRCGGVIDMGYGKNNNKTGRNGMAAGFGGYSEK